MATFVKATYSSSDVVPGADALTEQELAVLVSPRDVPLEPEDVELYASASAKVKELLSRAVAIREQVDCTCDTHCHMPAVYRVKPSENGSEKRACEEHLGMLVTEVVDAKVTLINPPPPEEEPEPESEPA